MREKDQAKLARESKREEKMNILRKKKLLFSRFVILCIMGALVFKVGYIKKAFGEEYERKAISKQISRTTERVINPRRGAILDRNRQSLAISTTVYNVILDIRVLVTKEEKIQNKTIVDLNETLGISMETLRDYLAVASRETDPSTGKETVTAVIDKNYYVIQKGISKEKAEELKEKKTACVYLEEDTKRTYPMNNIAAQVVGFIRDTPWGLERQYNEDLKGEAGRSFRVYDVEFNAVDQQIPAKEGNTLITTLDITLQQYAEDAVLKAGRDYNPQNASLIIMDPRTGEILAMAQYPSFNLNDPANLELLTNESLQEEWAALTPAEQMNKLYPIWTNYNLTSTYEPGSIFKPVVVAAALEENIISPRSASYYCGGSHVVAGTDVSIPCWYHQGHGTQTLNQVLANSCNAGMMQIINLMGRNTFYKYRNDFGFGEKSDIDLPAEEYSGSPSVMYTLSQLNPVELATSSMGQGFNNTPIQAINGFAAVINGGNLMKPYMVSQVIDNNGNAVKEYGPTVQRRVISKETSDYMRLAMMDVVSSTGTGKRGHLEGYDIGGKTGTGQQGIRDQKKNVLSYIAYLPADDPQIIALALIDRPENKDLESGVSVVPMLTEVLAKVIQYKNIQPSSAFSSTEDGARAFNSSATSFPLEDYRGQALGEVTKSLNALGLDYDFIGAGSVVGSQSPAPGAEVTSDSYIFLYLSNGDEPSELVYIPNVQNLPEGQAVEILQKAGFEPVVFGDEEVDGDEAEPPERIVYEQMPGAETRAPKGTQIKLKVSVS